MLGAILGDIIGSPWEGGSCADPNVELMGYGSVFTDDTVCTVAIAQALVEGVDIAQSLRSWVRRYPGRGYGGSFHGWAWSDNRGPYQSFANGGAMRVSPAGFLATSLEEALALATKTASVTHDHPEGIKGAQAISLAIWLAKSGASRDSIRGEIQRRIGYALNQTVADLSAPEAFGFSVLAEETVPLALTAALEARSFEQAMRHSLSIGGDTDTIACMAGGIAEALFGIPETLVQRGSEYLDVDMLDVVQTFYAGIGTSGPRIAEPLPDTAATPSMRWPRLWLARIFAK